MLLLQKPVVPAVKQLRRCSAHTLTVGRQQLQSSRSHVALCAAPDDGPVGEEITDIMKQDLERFTRQQPAATAKAAEQKQQTPSSPIKEAIDKVLIADFFFILLILAWLGAGLAEKGALHSSNLIDAWMPLWPLVFQPAIGILMAGALVSGALNWLAEQQQQQKSS